jgi:hypothetical protein
MTIEPRLVADPWSLVDGMADELRAYHALIPTRRRRAKRTAGRPPKGRQ